MNYKTMRNKIEDMAKDNYENFVKVVISMEKGINDEDLLSEMYTNYMENDSMSFLNEEFDYMVEEFNENEKLKENIKINSIKDISDTLYETLKNDEDLQKTALKAKKIVLGNNTLADFNFKLADFNRVFQREYAGVMREVAERQGNVPDDMKSLDNVRKLKEELEHRYDEYLNELYLETDEYNEYILLGRLKSDCDYYLGWGKQNPDCLYYHDENKHINAMKNIYNNLSDKPQWLTEYDLKRLEEIMCNRDINNEISNNDIEEEL